MLERDPAKTASDVENGYMTREAAEQVFGIVLAEDSDGGLAPDLDATASAAAACDGSAWSGPAPVAAWLAAERQRVERSDFAPEVRRMYRSAMRLSPRFAGEFRSFWGLESDHEVADGDAR